MIYSRSSFCFVFCYLVCLLNYPCELFANNNIKKKNSFHNKKNANLPHLHQANISQNNLVVSEKFEKAQTKNDYSLSNFDFDQSFYSISKKKENSFDASSSNYTLTSEDIRRSGASSVAESLRLVPGLQVARIDGNKWAISSRGFNRQYSNKLLIMVDGRIVYTPLFSGAYYDTIDYNLNDIEKIEVVKGSGGALWGYNAINGIINIVTKNTAQTKGFYSSQILGNYDKSITELRYGDKTTDGNYRLYFKNTQRDSLKSHSTNLNNNDELSYNRVGFRKDSNYNNETSLQISGEVSQGSSNNFMSPVEINQKKSTGAFVNLAIEKNLSKFSSLNFNSYLDYSSFKKTIIDYSLVTFDTNFQHFYQLNKDKQIAWGGEYIQFFDQIRSNYINNNGIVYSPLVYSPNKQSNNILSAFAQSKNFFFNQNLLVSIGSKFIHNNYTNFDWQPNINASYFPSDNQTIWAAVSRVSRIPTRGEDSLNIQTRIDNSYTTIQRGSSGFDNEELIAYEAGYRVKPTRKMMFDFSAFYNQYTKLRTFEPDSMGSLTIDNLGYGESLGFEATAKWQAAHNLKIEANYDYLKLNLGIKPYSFDGYSALNPNDGLEVAEGLSPKHQAKIKIFYNPTKKIELDNILYFVGNLNKGDSNDHKSSGISSYLRFDSRVAYLFNSNFDIAFTVQNALNQKHVEFRKPMFGENVVVGRYYYLKASLQY
jgi:iron complex outermembrane receptor protein